MDTRKNLNIWLMICSLMLVTVNWAAAETHYVDGGSIQEAIEGAVAGDEIEVAPGTYYEAINFQGKAIRLYSSDGPEVTTIDAQSAAIHVVQCVTEEGPDTVLDGFTITGGEALGGYDDSRGAGMFVRDSSPTVTNCIFTGNLAVHGAGMGNYNSSPAVTNCFFTWNHATYHGGAISCEGASSPRGKKGSGAFSVSPASLQTRRENPNDCHSFFSPLPLIRPNPHQLVPWVSVSDFLVPLCPHKGPSGLRGPDPLNLRNPRFPSCQFV